MRENSQDILDRNLAEDERCADHDRPPKRQNKNCCLTEDLQAPLLGKDLSCSQASRDEENRPVTEQLCLDNTLKKKQKRGHKRDADGSQWLGHPTEIPRVFVDNIVPRDSNAKFAEQGRHHEKSQERKRKSNEWPCHNIECQKKSYQIHVQEYDITQISVNEKCGETCRN